MIVPPDYLDAETRAVWDRLAPPLEAKGLLTDWDVDLFAVYCTAVVHHRRAVELVNQTNVLTKAAGASHVVKNPALQVVRDQAAILAALAGRFGLSPADRVGLPMPEERDADDIAFLALVQTPIRHVADGKPVDGRPRRRSSSGSAGPADDAVAKTGGRRRPRAIG
jgi:P27 family predicted phage terminase small subunit